MIFSVLIFTHQVKTTTLPIDGNAKYGGKGYEKHNEKDCRSSRVAVHPDSGGIPVSGLPGVLRIRILLRTPFLVLAGFCAVQLGCFCRRLQRLQYSDKSKGVSKRSGVDARPSVFYVCNY